MNRDFIINFLFSRSEVDKEKEILLAYIEEAKIEMEAANSIFQSVSDFELIDSAIYAEEAAKKKYQYLLSLMKARDKAK